MKGTTGLRENIRNFPLTGEGCATLDSVHSEPMRLPDQMDARTDGGSVRSQCPSTAGEPSLGRESIRSAGEDAELTSCRRCGSNLFQQTASDPSRGSGDDSPEERKLSLGERDRR